MSEAEKLINNLYGKGTIGFTCDSCGREINGCNIVNGMKFCAKCYQETFGKNNQQNEIQQLKEQLEALILEIRKQKVEQHDLPDYCTRTGTDCTNLGKIEELQRQLAEKDKEIKSLIADYEKRISQEQELMSNMEHQLTEKQNTIDEINKEFVQAVHDWKALCAEKDKEIEDMDKDLVFNANEIKRLIQEKKRLKQNQTQLAIQELEKVKAWLEPKYFDYEQINYLTRIIDNQIKELKGE